MIPASVRPAASSAPVDREELPASSEPAGGLVTWSQLSRQSTRADLPLSALHDEVVAVLRELLERAETSGLILTAVDGGSGLGLVVQRGDLKIALVVDQASGPMLSPRERQIARLVADGATNRAIGSALEISLWTVSTHLRRIFAKLGVGSRAEMVAQLFGAPQLPGRYPGAGDPRP